MLTKHNSPEDYPEKHMRKQSFHTKCLLFDQQSRLIIKLANAIGNSKWATNKSNSIPHPSCCWFWQASLKGWTTPKITDSFVSSVWSSKVSINCYNTETSLALSNCLVNTAHLKDALTTCFFKTYTTFKQMHFNRVAVHNIVILMPSVATLNDMQHK